MSSKIIAGFLFFLTGALVLVSQPRVLPPTKNESRITALETELAKLKQKNVEQEKLLKKLVDENQDLKRNNDKIIEILDKEDECSLESNN